MRAETGQKKEKKLSGTVLIIEMEMNFCSRTTHNL
jgi:hypothetical protein